MIALLALPTGIPPSRDAIVGGLEGQLGESAVWEISPEGGHVDARIARERVRFVPTASPIPSEILEQPCSTAWYWPEAASVLQGHRSQLAIIVEGPGNPVHHSLLLSRLVTTLGQAFDYVGVYWDSATMVHPPRAFDDAAREMSLDNLPLRLWIDFRFIPSPENDTLSLATFGLHAFQQMEIEVRDSMRSPQELVRWAFNTAYYLVDGGKVEDDQTVGWDEERVLVRHEGSMFDGERTVLVLKV